jgi:hypothetical protein
MLKHPDYTHYIQAKQQDSALQAPLEDFKGGATHRLSA